MRIIPLKNLSTDGFVASNSTNYDCHGACKCYVKNVPRFR